MELDVPPPGAGVYTATVAVPTAEISEALTFICNWVLLTNVVVRDIPFHNISEAGTNPDPFTVKVNAPLPTAALLGLIEVATGAAF